MRANPVPQRYVPAIQHRSETMSTGHMADDEEAEEGEPQTPGHRDDAASDGSHQSAHDSPLAMAPAATPNRPAVPSTPSSRRTARPAASASARGRNAAGAAAANAANTSPYPLLSKRKVHNLNSMMPPIFVEMPGVPVNDQELIV